MLTLALHWETRTLWSGSAERTLGRFTLGEGSEVLG